MTNMTLKDKEQLRRWFAGGASLADVESASQYGILGNERFTDAAVRAYKLLWSWGAPRFSGSAGLKQDRYANKCGFTALYRRFDRCKAIAVRLGFLQKF